MLGRRDHEGSMCTYHYHYCMYTIYNILMMYKVGWLHCAKFWVHYKHGGRHVVKASMNISFTLYRHHIQGYHFNVLCLSQAWRRCSQFPLSVLLMKEEIWKGSLQREVAFYCGNSDLQETLICCQVSGRLIWISNSYSKNLFTGEGPILCGW